MTIFHGTNVDIQGGIRKGTFFTDNFTLALNFMRHKKGNKIYAFSSNKDVINYFFNKVDDFYTLGNDMTVDSFTCLTVDFDRK